MLPELLTYKAVFVQKSLMWDRNFHFSSASWRIYIHSAFGVISKLGQADSCSA